MPAIKLANTRKTRETKKPSNNKLDGLKFY